MRTFIATLVLIFSLQSWSKAGDISEFEIQGMSIGDSLLNFFEKSHIEKRKDSYHDKGYMYSSKSYYALTFDEFANQKQYDQIQFHLKDKDETYKIYALTGIKLFKYNIEECTELMKEIEFELDSLLTNANKVSEPKHKSWTGKGYITSTWYKYNDGSNINLACEDWNEDSNIPDGLAISITSKEFQQWVNDL
tara:strand:- start:199 stop:777 length:579 start_codon:yes stop_codon:yes gene_type:complete